MPEKTGAALKDWEGDGAESGGGAELEGLQGGWEWGVTGTQRWVGAGRGRWGDCRRPKTERTVRVRVIFGGLLEPSGKKEVVNPENCSHRSTFSAWVQATFAKPASGQVENPLSSR